MTRKNIQGVMAADVINGGNFNTPYPPGTERGDFLNGFQHSIVVGQTDYRSPNKMAISLIAGANLTVINRSGLTWVAGTPFILSLDVGGPGSGVLSADGKYVMPRVVDWATVFLNLGNPLALSANGIRAAAAVPAAGPMAGLLLGKLDVPRNVTIQCLGADAARTFTVTGKDLYGYTMVEAIAGAAIGTTPGKKAFDTITSISSDAATAGNVNVGWGNVLGLPCFVQNAAYVVKESQDAGVAAAGTFVAGDQTPASAVTGDVRGTYVPAAAPDGLKAYGLICALPDPGYSGADQFAG